MGSREGEEEGRGGGTGGQFNLANERERESWRGATNVAGFGEREHVEGERQRERRVEW
jgi:hypothetical protein